MKYYLGLGSNLGDSRSYLRKALELIESRGIGKILSRSSLYLTEPVAVSGQEWFLNAAVAIESSLAPKKMLAELKKIEADLGREKSAKSRQLPRPIDLDILIADDIITSDDNLIIPHPRMQDRRFVLEPLAEIAGRLVHPVLEKSVVELLGASKDKAQVRKLEEKL